MSYVDRHRHRFPLSPLSGILAYLPWPLVDVQPLLYVYNDSVCLLKKNMFVSKKRPLCDPSLRPCLTSPRLLNSFLYTNSGLPHVLTREGFRPASVHISPLASNLSKRCGNYGDARAKQWRLSREFEGKEKSPRLGGSANA